MPDKKEKKRTKSSSKKKKSSKQGPPEISFDSIIFDSEKDFLGEGAFGKVFKSQIAGKAVAVKFPRKTTLTENELKAFRSEIRIMRKIYHPNVVLFLGACTDQGHLAIITELLTGDVEHLLEKPPKDWTLERRMNYAKDAALGMNWLHNICKIIHRDLKPANLLIDENDRVKVTDFGFSRSLKAGQNLVDIRGPKGTALYMPPEVLLQEEFNFSIDVYAFGLILWELLTLDELFGEFEDLEPFVEAVCFDERRPPIPKNTVPTLKKLMQSCWAQKKEERPDFEKIVDDMNHVLIEVLLSDKSAQDFWKKKYLTKDGPTKSVPLNQFLTDFSAHIDEDVSKLKVLKHLLDNEVTIENVDLLCRWFGSLFDKHSGKKITNYVLTLLDHVEREDGFFHGNIDKTAAEKRLTDQADDTFLIRLSKTTPDQYPFTISKVKKGNFIHMRVSRTSYEWGKPQLQVKIQKEDLAFKHLGELVSTLKKKKLLDVSAQHVAPDGGSYGQFN